MARSVIRTQSERCPRCLVAPRWCVCEALRPLDCALGVEVLMHDSEAMRPSSTGHLISRAFPNAKLHFYRAERNEDPLPDAAQAGRELWILHPHGETMPSPPPPPATLSVLLIDASWSQSTIMMRRFQGARRRISLPMSGQSRYWLRSHQGGERYSTAEALLFLLRALDLKDCHREFSALFELHVLAHLLARGQRDQAQAYLESSTLRGSHPALVERLFYSRRSSGETAELGQTPAEAPPLTGHSAPAN